MAATLRLMDDHAAELGATWKGTWREFLRVGNVLQAGTWVERAGKVKEPGSTDNAEAVIAIREGRHGDAVRFLAAARARIVRLKLDSGLARFAKEQLAEYAEMCKSATTDVQV